MAKSGKRIYFETIKKYNNLISIIVKRLSGHNPIYLGTQESGPPYGTGAVSGHNPIIFFRQ